MDEEDLFSAALLEKGKEHEKLILQSHYPHGRRLEYETREDGFMQTINSMAAGSSEILHGMLFYAPGGMHGYPDVLEKRKGKSAWGNHHYVVNEIKLTAHVGLKHVLQAAFYNLMLGYIQGYTPERFFITNGHGDVLDYAHAEYEQTLLDTIRYAAEIYGGLEPPAVHGGCEDRWNGYCNSIAIENDDVSLITGIGVKLREGMVGAGFKTVQDVACSSPDALEVVYNVGKTKAASLFDKARALKSGKPVRRQGSVNLPERSTEVFLDLEGLSEIFDPDLKEYLIGAVVRKDRKEEYHAFVAENKREDVMLRQFLDFMGEQEDYVMYHWGSYEKSHMGTLMETHGMKAQYLLEQDVLVDLLPLATAAFSFPTRTNSIKSIARWRGYVWTHKDVNATSAINTYLMYVDDPVKYGDAMKKVLEYNRNDCVATRIIKDWLVDNA